MSDYSDYEQIQLTEKLSKLDREARAQQNELDRVSQEKQTAMLTKALNGIRYI